MMTISQFSDRTGLSPSALRYYEAQGLLEPAERQPNGYRRYSELQVPVAKLINSLRQSGISMAEIARFLGSSHTDKAEFLTRWRREAEARLLSIQVARHYLMGLDAHSPPFHLLRWEKPVPMLWLRQWIRPNREASLPPLLAANHDLLIRHSIRTRAGAYVRFLASAPSGFDLEVGYELEAPRRRALPPELGQARQELVPPTLFATLECTVESSLVCLPAIQSLRRYGFEPVGPRLERHLPGFFTYEMMIPVIQSEISS